jgi:hypothetical protein
MKQTKKQLHAMIDIVFPAIETVEMPDWQEVSIINPARRVCAGEKHLAYIDSVPEIIGYFHHLDRFNSPRWYAHINWRLSPEMLAIIEESDE